MSTAFTLTCRTRRLEPELRAGTIVNIASWAARNLVYFPGAAYNASKRGVLA